MTKEERKVKKRYIMIRAIALLLVVLVIAFVWFLPIGYRMTVSIHGFDRIADPVYVNQGFQGSTEEALRIVEQARQRVSEYFGEIESAPVIILCDDIAKLNKLGGVHDTSTLMLVQVQSYIVISDEYLNVDVVAHELTHAEVHYRAYKGKLWFQVALPTWFDEGFATQNDDRDLYSEGAWIAVTDNGKNVAALSDMDTPAKFYAGDSEARRYRYIVSKHELKEWIDQNGKEALFDLLSRLNQGENFDALYYQLELH